MKKYFLTIIACLAFLTAVPAQAQTTKLHFGVKGGLNITEFSFSDKIFSAENKMGFFAGPSFYFGLPVIGLGADISGLYNERKVELDGQSVKRKSLDVPVNVRYSFGFSEEACLYFAAGPQFSFALGDKALSLKSDNDLRDVDWEFKNTVLTFNVGGGLVINHLQISASYNIPISKTGDFKWKEATDKVFHGDSKTKGWQIAAAYYF